MDATAMADMNESILKSGRRGHLRWTPEQKRKRSTDGRWAVLAAGA
jgi:hypothetical protein